MSAPFKHTVRVRYAECDSMGFVHHSVYATYFEEARTEAMRALGINYKELEDAGIIMPVRSMDFQFKKAGFYDEVLTILVHSPEVQGIRCRFCYETRNALNELLNTGNTELFFALKASLKPIKLPRELEEKFTNVSGKSGSES